MNAVTIYPPWPWAITHGEKRIDNRNWPPRLNRGDELAIHAAARLSFDEEALDHFKELEEQGLGGFREPVPDDGFAANAIVAVVRYWGYITQCPSAESSQGLWWVPGGVGWVFDEVTVLPSPVGCLGKQRLWMLPRAVHHDVQHQLGKATVRWTKDGWDIAD